jgi:hypothetical protein
MPSYLFIIGYCVLASVVALVVQQFVPRFIWLALLAPTLAAIALQIIVYLYLGYVDAWADIAFITTWLIALACTTAVYVLRLMWNRLKKNTGRLPSQ